MFVKNCFIPGDISTWDSDLNFCRFFPFYPIKSKISARLASDKSPLPSRYYSLSTLVLSKAIIDCFPLPICGAIICCIKGNHRRTTLNLFRLKNVVYGDGSYCAEWVEAALLPIFLFLLVERLWSNQTNSFNVISWDWFRYFCNCAWSNIGSIFDGGLVLVNKTVLFYHTLGTPSSAVPTPSMSLSISSVFGALSCRVKLFSPLALGALVVPWTKSH
jgi:hypothetical protein